MPSCSENEIVLFEPISAMPIYFGIDLNILKHKMYALYFIRPPALFWINNLRKTIIFARQSKNP